MSKKKRKRTEPAADQYITISMAEYHVLTRAATLLEIIMHDHTPYHDAVGIVKNVLIDNGLLPGAGGDK